MGLILGKGIKADEINGRHLKLITGDYLRAEGEFGATENLLNYDLNSDVMILRKDTSCLHDFSIAGTGLHNGPQGSADASIARRDFVESSIATAIGGITSGTTWLQPIRQLTSNPTSISNIVANDRAIVGATPAGDFAGFTEGDIVLYDGSAWGVQLEVENINSGSAIYPTDMTNQFYTFIDGTGWLDHFFEATTVMAASVLKLTGLELSLEEQNDGQIILGQGTGNQPEPKSMSGDATISKTGVITISDDAITESKINDDAVTANKIAPNAVTSGKINPNAVTTAKILDGNVTTAKIANDAITTDKILNGTILEADLSTALQNKINEEGGHEVDGTSIEEYIDSGNNNANTLRVKAAGISDSHLASDAVTTSKVANLNITKAKLAQSLQDEITANTNKASGHGVDNITTFESQDGESIVSNGYTCEIKTVQSGDVSAQKITLTGQDYHGNDNIDSHIMVYGVRFDATDDVDITITNDTPALGVDGSHDVEIDWSNCSDLVNLIDTGDVIKVCYALYNKNV